MGRRHRPEQHQRRIERKRSRERLRAYTQWFEALPIERQEELEDRAVAGREDEYQELERALGAPEL